MTPDDLARLKALAEAATPGKRLALVRTGRNPPRLSPEWQIIAATAHGHGIYSDHPGGCSPSADMEFIAACDPTTILALIAAASPVPAGEFEERLAPVYGEPWRESAGRLWDHAGQSVSIGYVLADRIATCVNACAGIADPPYFIAALTRSHATLLAERDAARAACAALVAWFDSEDRGPAYPEGMTRDSPGGENVWRGWWEENLQLCDRAGKLARAALESAP